MAARKKRQKRRGYSQEISLILTGSALTLCFLSVMYGFLIRQSIAEPPRFRIEILNGTGEDGLARAAAESLRRRGIDVFHVGNAPEFSHRESILIERRSVEGLEKLGRDLGCDDVVAQWKKGSLVDATLIIGADYARLNLGLEDDSRLFE